MYENTLSVPAEHKHIFDFVVTQLADSMSQISALTVVTQSADRLYYTYACDEVFRKVICRDVADVAARALSMGYKNLYLRRLLDVNDEDFFQNVLVDVICVFDSAVDAQALTSVVCADKPLYLDGYYLFKMGAMKRKWSELSQLVGANRYVLEDGELVLEFLQYLTEQSSGKRHKMSLILDADGFCLFDGNNKLMPTLQTLARRVCFEEEAVVNLVCNKPAQLTVYCKNAPSKMFISAVSALFDVNFVYV